MASPWWASQARVELACCCAGQRQVRRQRGRGCGCCGCCVPLAGVHTRGATAQKRTRKCSNLQKSTFATTITVAGISGIIIITTTIFTFISAFGGWLSRGSFCHLPRGCDVGNWRRGDDYPHLIGAPNCSICSRHVRPARRRGLPCFVHFRREWNARAAAAPWLHAHHICPQAAAAVPFSTVSQQRRLHVFAVETAALLHAMMPPARPVTLLACIPLPLFLVVLAVFCGGQRCCCCCCRSSR